MAEAPTVKVSKGSAMAIINESDLKRFQGMGYKLVGDKPEPEPKPVPDPVKKEDAKAAKADTQKK